ncbi:MAG: ATP-binding cassette domain-containing protein [Ruminococcaceae bacterium]|nr:ATP-binding cassette domain-containing protein [Oscillospiraceae bacterium]
MIELKHLHKYFNKGKQNEIHVINDVSLSLPERGMVAIFGRSGCGKTTLLNVIGGLDRFGSGTLTVAGQSIKSDTDTIRNRYIGYIFQNYNLSREESCYDNVANALRLCGMADGKEMEERVAAALTNVGMEHYAARTPDTLSGGQQQRIAIARAIVKNPRIILADEPTGNLDEANTVMIMDLLKQIAKDHLVLLVTHEANLVDYYCDTVVELQDGAVVSVRHNDNADGFVAKDKNHIYLGELQETACKDANVAVSYYGDTPEEPVQVKIVNHGGKLYVRVDTPKVQVLDDTSEIKLKEGVYETKAAKKSSAERIDMSALPPVMGTRFGRLFSLRSSVKSGYNANFKQNKRGKSVLRRCMSLFAAALVFMTAYFGTAIGDLLNANSAYNHNIFYLYTGNEEISNRINQAAGQHGIDYLYLTPRYAYGDETLTFHIGAFETFDSYTNINTNAVLLGASLLDDTNVLAGKGTPNADEMILSSAVADKLLKESPVGYISGYEDLIGLICGNIRHNEKRLRVAGVVESDETSAYVADVTLAGNTFSNSYQYEHGILLDKSIGVSVNPGEVFLISASVTLPDIGEEVTVRGRRMQIADVGCFGDYQEYLKRRGIEKASSSEYFEALGITEGSVIDQRFYEYADYYFAELDAYMKNRALCYPHDMDVWLYTKKGVTAIKYLYAYNHEMGGEEYYEANRIKAATGAYPSRNDVLLGKPSDGLQGALKDMYTLYEEEFYGQEGQYPQLRYQICYVVNEADYVALARQVGLYSISSSVEGGEYYPEDDGKLEKLAVTTNEVILDMDYYGLPMYTVIHSSDPEATAAFLAAEFGDVVPPYDYMDAIVTPQNIFDDLMLEIRVEILINLITMALVFSVMSLCMYFIMRSSLMNRIKEVGIYRAIGVSKKNLVFKFLIEALVLTTLTVMVGFVVCSAFVYACLGISPLVEAIFFYPPWVALALLCLLYLLCTLCGVLPILLLLRKTPSEILAKYDI